MYGIKEELEDADRYRPARTLLCDRNGTQMLHPPADVILLRDTRDAIDAFYAYTMEPSKGDSITSVEASPFACIWDSGETRLSADGGKIMLCSEKQQIA